MNGKYLIPSRSKNADGKIRKVGFELEFSGIEVQETAEIVAHLFSGTLEKDSKFEYTVSSDPWGEFTIELDWQLGRKIAQSRHHLPLSDTTAPEDDLLLRWLQSIAGQVVPVEIVCPPLPLDQLEILDPLVQAIRESGAQGTTESIIYAFGVHINPEIPDTSPVTLTKYIQAFSIAQEWLFLINHVDPIRRITPYIKPFPKDYLKLVFQYTFSITIEQMIDDYLQFNHTRNRALDLLPLWNHMDPKQVKDFGMADTLTKPRPTFHYRLPNCEIEQNGWFLNKSWNIWCVIEHIAADENMLSEFIDQWYDSLDKIHLTNERPWHKRLESIYHSLS